MFFQLHLVPVDVGVERERQAPGVGKYVLHVRRQMHAFLDLHLAARTRSAGGARQGVRMLDF